jgi:hypothetical protein
VSAADRQDRTCSTARAACEAGPLEANKLTVDLQLQRVETTAAAGDEDAGPRRHVPMPDIPAVALAHRRAHQASARESAEEVRQTSGFVFTTRFRPPIEPRNSNRHWDRRCDEAGSSHHRPGYTSNLAVATGRGLLL